MKKPPGKYRKTFRMPESEGCPGLHGMTGDLPWREASGCTYRGAFAGGCGGRAMSRRAIAGTAPHGMPARLPA